MFESVKCFVKVCDAEDDACYIFFGPDHKLYNMTNTILGELLSGNLPDCSLCEPIIDGVWTENGDYQTRHLTWSIGTNFLDFYDIGDVKIQSDVVMYVSGDGSLHILDYALIRDFFSDRYLGTYLTLASWAKREGKSVQSAKLQCQKGHVPRAVKLGNMWLIPSMVSYPTKDDYRDISAKILSVPQQALTREALDFLNMYNVKNECPLIMAKRPSEGVLFRIAVGSFSKYVRMRDDLDYCPFSMILPPSLDAVFNIALEDDYDTIDIVDTSKYPITLTAWIDANHPVYGQDDTEDLDVCRCKFNVATAICLIDAYNNPDTTLDDVKSLLPRIVSPENAQAYEAQRILTNS